MEFLTRITPYFQIVRLKNLFIIALTQFVFYQYLIRQLRVETKLDYLSFCLLSGSTIIVAAAGYLINDIFDQKTDSLNKAHLSYIPEKIGNKSAKTYYISLLVSALIISLSLDLTVSHIYMTLIAIIFSAFLYAYAKFWKGTIIFGNVVVSLLVSSVTGILFLAERETITVISNFNNSGIIFEIFAGYMIFSFLVNLIREIIKDIEDHGGDKHYGVQTLPVVYGIEVAKSTCMFLSLFTVLIASGWLLVSHEVKDFRYIVFVLLLVVSPLIFIIQILAKSASKKDFTKISSILKWIMLTGIGSIILISNNLSHYLNHG
ncbi:MAG: geranylgeranylglycerol-phosphate geranylgeranyltransferase [Saprospiraceae bacterium]